MNVQGLDSANLIAYLQGSATPIVPDRANATASLRGVTLGAGTYYFPIDSAAAEDLVHISIRWAAAVTGTVTFETTDYPQTLRDGNTVDVTDFQASGVDWFQENPSTGVVSVSGGGNSATALTVTAGGTTAGQAGVHLGTLGAARIRVKIVTSVGGIVRVACNGKRPGGV